MARNISNMRKLHDYSQLTNEEKIETYNRDSIKRMKQSEEENKGKIKKLLNIKVGFGFFENFKLILDTRVDNHRNLF